MKKDYAKLRRRPLLTPVWLTALVAVAALLVVGFAVWTLATADSAIIIVTSEEGQTRADQLAEVFGGNDSAWHIDAIYASRAASRQTATALAARLKIALEPTSGDEPKDLAGHVLSASWGKRVLIIERSEVIAALVAALSGAREAVPLSEQGGVMYVVSVPRIGHANVLRMHY